MTAPIDNFIGRLDGVRQTGPGRYVALCPAHDDKSPSLTIRETDDGAVLIKCWSGCAFEDIVNAVGLEPRDLFPAKALPVGTHSTRGHRKPFAASDVLAAVAHEAVLVAITARDIANGEVLDRSGIERLMLASGRLLTAAGATA